MEENILMAIDLPVTDEAKSIEGYRFNRVQENLIYLMGKKNVNLAEVCRQTMIPMTTAYGWLRGHTKTQLADINLVELARYFDVELEWLICNEKYEDEKND